MYDVAIVGGGPGGLYAALQLSARGFGVAVFEEHAAAGDPVHCTGVLAAETFEEFGLSRRSFLNPLSTATFFGPSGAAVDYTTPETEAVVIDRRVFDAELADRAAAAGAHIVLGARAIDVVQGRDSVLLTIGGIGEVRARAAILACGASYAFQRRLGFGMPARHLQSAQLEIPAARPGDVEVHFGHDVAPKGFAWVVPVVRAEGTFARIGLMCAGNARARFDRFLASVGPRWGAGEQSGAGGGLEPRCKMLPLGPLPRTFGDRILAVGDAAGIVKPTTGGGIYYSLVSARIAAEVLGDAMRRDTLGEENLALFEQRWQRELGPEIDAQSELRRLSHELTDADIDELFDLARTDGIMPIVRQTARFNRHRHLIASLLNHPPARRLLMKRVLGWGRSA